MVTLKEIEEKIQKSIPALRIKGVLKKRTETPKEFLVKFFNKWNDEKQTIFTKERTIQTDIKKRRSIGDIYRILKYYYPNITLQEITDIVYNDLFEEVPRFRSSYCNTIKKRVFYKGTDGQESDIFDRTKPDEFGLKVDDWEEN